MCASNLPYDISHKTGAMQKRSRNNSYHRARSGGMYTAGCAARLLCLKAFPRSFELACPMSHFTFFRAENRPGLCRLRSTEPSCIAFSALHMNAIPAAVHVTYTPTGTRGAGNMHPPTPTQLKLRTVRSASVSLPRSTTTSVCLFNNIILNINSCCVLSRLVTLTAVPSSRAELPFQDHPQ